MDFFVKLGGNQLFGGIAIFISIVSGFWLAFRVTRKGWSAVARGDLLKAYELYETRINDIAKTALKDHIYYMAIIFLRACRITLYSIVSTLFMLCALISAEFYRLDWMNYSLYKAFSAVYIILSAIFLVLTFGNIFEIGAISRRVLKLREAGSVEDVEE